MKTTKNGLWYVYILRCGDGTLYTGYTNDLEARLAAHRDGKGAKYTRGRGPLELVYQEALDNNIAAMHREREIQKLTRPAKERLTSTHPDHVLRILPPHPG